jgi:Lrp/AsnC family transcriptional regulator, leucine-responsive regulatory protein
MFGEMADSLDEIDLKLLTELQVDADRTNVELARLVGLSPAATLNRVRRLKENGTIQRVIARLDAAQAGFPLRAYVSVVLARHDTSIVRAFVKELQELPQVIGADWVAGETDAIVQLVARNVPELQRVLLRLSARGAQRMITYLCLEEIKSAAPLPV